jgi:FkbM family methyltransferase
VKKDKYLASRRVQALLGNAEKAASLVGQQVEYVKIESGTTWVGLTMPPPTTAPLELAIDPGDFRDAAFTALREGAYETKLSAMLWEVAGASRCFWDVGANIGFYSISCAKLNPRLEVHAFEPNPDILPRLRQNATRNGVETQINSHALALGSQTAELALFVPKTTGSGGGSLRNLHPEEGAALTHTVQVRNPESLELQAPDLMKVDAEGAEFSILSADSAWVFRSKPTIFVELLRKWMAPFESSPQDVLELAFGHGYHAFAIGEDRLAPIERIDNRTVETNFVLVHPGQVTHSSILNRFLGANQ